MKEVKGGKTKKGQKPLLYCTCVFIATVDADTLLLNHMFSHYLLGERKSLPIEEHTLPAFCLLVALIATPVGVYKQIAASAQTNQACKPARGEEKKLNVQLSSI